MDDRQDFSTSSDANALETGIETPVVNSGDERRMHVRAYNYWVSLLDGKEFPSVEDLDPESLEDFGPHSVLIDFTSGIENPAIVYIGQKLYTECDLTHPIEDVAQVPPRTLLSRLTDHYMQIIANRAPVGFEAEFTNQRKLDMAYRGILLPFSSDDDSIDFIYGVINWKQVATGDLTKSLHDEIERALAQAPLPVAPPSPVWADGPGAQRSAEPSPAIFGVEDADHDEAEELADLAPETDNLADWLASAREAAETALRYDRRGRSALYRAIGLAYDFALIAAARPSDYAELLAASGLVAQARAPMTPLVKLVFGADYDKTRLTEYAAVLTFAMAHEVPMGSLADVIEAHPGHLKGLLKAAREAKHVAKSTASRATKARERARTLSPKMIIAQAGDDEFVLLLARRVDPGHIGVLGVADLDDAGINRALAKLKA